MIVIKNLSKVYHLKSGDVTALENVSMTVQEGEIFGVIGNSGAGKSTLVRCINLLELPDSGSVTVNGTTLFQTEENGTLVVLPEKELNRQRRQIGMIFQHFNLLDRSTVFDNVAYPLKYSGLTRKEIRRRVGELLELVDLKDKASVYPSQLSGGQKQRVAIARALANNPRVLLSDEATSALDPDATESILQLLEKLNRELGLTIVIITHEMAVIRAICDKVAVMEQGHVVECGDTYRIFSRPRAEITRRFVSSTSGFSQADKLIARWDEILAGKENGAFYLLLFTRDSLSQATVSRISREYGVDLDILLANIELLRGGSIGRMLVAASGNGESIQAALRDLKQHHVEVREVTGYAVD
ncbi:MAG TPA: ATP-binding cassette domain-containing protein [Clostridiaceae bacterium]|nr:ATP-binding cassette domain-containing protein [Clostridiaceae bacterium]